MEDEQYWVTMDPELMESDGEVQALMLAWMQKAKARGAFNTVEKGGKTEEWKVSAGTSVGFMGCTKSPGEESGQIDSEWSGGRSTGRREGFYKDLDLQEVKYGEK